MLVIKLPKLASAANKNQNAQSCLIIRKYHVTKLFDHFDHMTWWFFYLNAFQTYFEQAGRVMSNGFIENDSSS
jgi:hypothetical protein